MLALALFGLSSAWAASPHDVTVNLAGITHSTWSGAGAGTAQARVATARQGLATVGGDRLAQWGTVGGGAQDSVWARFVWETTGSNGGIEQGRYLSVLTLESGTAVDTIRITGALPAGAPLTAIRFTGTSVKAVLWDGAAVAGKAPLAASGTAAAETVPTEFLRWGTGANTDGGIEILSGVISTQSPYLLRNVGARNGSGGAGRGANVPNVVGAATESDANDRAITLTAKAEGGAALHGTNIVLGNPGKGNYTITGLLGPAITDEGNFIIGRAQGTATLDKQGSLDDGTGTLEIRGWSDVASAAHWTTGGVVGEEFWGAINSKGSLLINASSRPYRTIITSKGKFVLNSSAAGTVKAWRIVLDHIVTDRTEGAVAVRSKDGALTMSELRVRNTTTLTKALVGQIAASNGAIEIDRGTYSAASGKDGNAVNSANSSVLIKGTAITSGSRLGGAVAGYVVTGKTGVTVLAHVDSDARVAWTGAGDSVGAIQSPTKVEISARDQKTVRVEVAGGSGVGIEVSNKDAAAGLTAVSVKGLENSVSAFVTVATGQAIKVNLSNNSQTDNRWVILDDAVISGGVTRVDPITKRTTLVDVTGANIEILGSTKNLSRIGKVTGEASDAVFAGNEVSGTSNWFGGDVIVRGGSVYGKNRAIDAVTISVLKKAVTNEIKDIELKSDAGITLNARGYRDIPTGTRIEKAGDVTINNPNAWLRNDNGAVGTDQVPGAIVYSATGFIKVLNVDTISTVKTTATAAALRTAMGKVEVYAGFIRSHAGNAIYTIDNDVWVDYTNNDAAVASNADVTVGVNKDIVLNSTGYVIGKKGVKHPKITILTGGGAAYSAIAVKNGDIKVGWATVEATGSQAAAIRDTLGTVLVHDSNAIVRSATGTAIYLKNPPTSGLYAESNAATRTGEFAVAVGKGEVKSSAASFTSAAIFVEGGSVVTGWRQADEASAVDARNDRQYTYVTSAGGALGIYVTGSGDKKVVVKEWTKMKVQGSAATAGAVKVTDIVKIDFRGSVDVTTSGSLAFALESQLGLIEISGDATITSQNCDGAVRTTGGNINVNSTSKAGVNKDGGITGQKGSLLRTLSTANVRPGSVNVFKGFVYNHYGKAILAEGEVYVYGIVSKTETEAAVSDGPVTTTVKTDTDTAIVARSATYEGKVYIRGGKIWAGGANLNGKNSPVAICAKQVFVRDNASRAGDMAWIWANTDRNVREDKEEYSNSFATGIVIPVTSPTVKGKGRLEIYGAEGDSTWIRAFGANTGINNLDTLVTVVINGYGRNGVKIWSGDNGTAIRSVGRVEVDGTTSTFGLSEEPDSWRENNGMFDVHIKTGNGVNARGILIPVPKSALTPVAYLRQAVLEGGSDGAIGLESFEASKDSLYKSVVLVRHGSTGISARGGLYVYGSYIEVLATEDNQTGTAITGSDIRIAGGRDEDEPSQSEIHTRGTAVIDTREGKTIQVTGTVKMTGTVGSNLLVGSSVMGDSAHLSAGSELSWNLWRLSSNSELTRSTEEGKALIIPENVTVTVSDNASIVETELSDTIKIEGSVTTRGTQAGAQFRNTGKTIIEKGGNVLFNRVDVNSFINDGGLVVLKTGTRLNDSALVHDTGAFMKRQYTFLKWADSLSAGLRSNGSGRVVVPPLYATLYGDVSVFVRTEDRGFWDEFSARTDTVYDEKYIVYPLDKRYDNYLETPDSLAKGDRFLSGNDVIETPLPGVLLTEAGFYTRVAKMVNEAGEGTKEYNQTVLRRNLKQIKRWQDDDAAALYFFDGYLNNRDGRLGEEFEEFGDTVTVRTGDVTIKYTGNPAKLLDGVKGAVFGDYRKWTSDDNDGVPVTVTGLGTHQLWYRGIDGTYYPLTSNVPTKVGSYEVRASFAQGKNFDEVPASESDLVYIGRLNVEQGDIVSVFGKVDNESYIEFVKLQAKTARNGITVTLPDLTRYGAAYVPAADIDIDGSGEGALVRNSIKLPANALTFNVNKNSDLGQFVDLKVGIVNSGDLQNFVEGLTITVHIDFVSEAEMKEATPQITVNYRNEKLTGFVSGTTYTINGEAVEIAKSEIAVNPEWKGTTISIVANPTAQGMYASEPAQLKIGGNAEISDALRAVTGDNSATNVSSDGRLNGTTVAMEYKPVLAADTAWKPAGNVVTGNLRSGDYSVRIAASDSLFPSEAVTVTINPTTMVSVAEIDRVVPGKGGATEAAIAPVAKVTASVTVGPNPVAASGEAKIFWSGSKPVKGTLTVFSSAGKKVASVKVSGTKQVGAWSVKNAAAGTYLLKGTLTGNGEKVTVSTPIAVVR